MSYKRFTERNGEEVITNCKECEYDKEHCMICTEYHCIDALKNRLAELEDKIEQGKIIELPCKVGDTVWVLDRNNKLIKMEITEYSLSETLKRYYAVSVLEGYGYWLYENELNYDWFLTKSEAEAKLREIKGR